MVETRLIPCLLLDGASLCKTVRFKKPQYIGDPVNTCKIFNELEVDELCFLDISATREARGPNYKVLQDLANECFMPLAYGGGVDSSVVAERIFKLGFEKVVINSAATKRPELITELANNFGSQSVVISIDVRKNMWGSYHHYSHSGSVKCSTDLLTLVKEFESRGAGELLLTAVDLEGTWKGFDIKLIKMVSNSLNIPVIAHGGAGSPSDIGDAVNSGEVNAVAAGSMFVFQKKGLGVLVNFPSVAMREAISSKGASNA